MAAAPPPLATAGRRRSSDEPATDALTITPSDSTDLTTTPRSIYVGSGGTLTVITLAGNTLAIKVYDGQVLPLACVARVKSTGTDASSLLALY